MGVTDVLGDIEISERVWPEIVARAERRHLRRESVCLVRETRGGRSQAHQPQLQAHTWYTGCTHVPIWVSLLRRLQIDRLQAGQRD